MKSVPKNVYDYLKKEFLLHRWVFAKTMPKNPHEYTLREGWMDDDAFVAVVHLMREHGYVEHFYGKPYLMINIDGMKYWTMGNPIESTRLINRKRIDQDKDYQLK